MRKSFILTILIVLALVICSSCSKPSENFSTGSDDDVVDITQTASALPTSSITKAAPKPEELHKGVLSPQNLPKCVDQFAGVQKVWQKMHEVKKYYGQQQYKHELGDRCYINGNPMADMSNLAPDIEARMQEKVMTPENKAATDSIEASGKKNEDWNKKDKDTAIAAGREALKIVADSGSTIFLCTPVPLLETWNTENINGIENVKSWGTHGAMVRIKGRRRGEEGNWYFIQLMGGSKNEIRGWIPEDLISTSRSNPSGGVMGVSLAACGGGG